MLSTAYIAEKVVKIFFFEKNGSNFATKGLMHNIDGVHYKTERCKSFAKSCFHSLTLGTIIRWRLIGLWTFQKTEPATSKLPFDAFTAHRSWCTSSTSIEILLALTRTSIFISIMVYTLDVRNAPEKLCSGGLPFASAISLSVTSFESKDYPFQWSTFSQICKLQQL